MYIKNLLKGIGLTILFTLVKSENCDYLDKYDSIGSCYNDENQVPYLLYVIKLYNFFL